MSAATLLCCCSASIADVADTEGTEKNLDYIWEYERKQLLPATDLVLIYGGGKHREATWNKEHLLPYVSYKDKTNVTHWLFDGFLFIEFTNGASGNPRIFATGYYGQPAGKAEWAALAEYYFTKNNAVYALEQCVADAEKQLGKPAKKRKVVISMPEPIVAGPGSHYTQLPADYWGEVDGVQLNFSNDKDRITACKWYIDYVRKLFNDGKFQHLELAGFYWLAEETLHTKTILADVANYLNGLKYSFNWIPYWKTVPDYYEWKSLKFNYAYLQPNYFFNNKLPYSRLTEACHVARQYEMDLELEFDVRVFYEKENWAYRLRDYMKAFREIFGIWETKRIAYYQGTDALYFLSKATHPEDQQLYHDFCSFVVEHQLVYH
ncbi:DUF4855 domain-containing protein [Bacteroidia bacterium]|nr:DUF4855 domain-containing protein [Bacteroidia bacterium]